MGVVLVGGCDEPLFAVGVEASADGVEVFEEHGSDGGFGVGVSLLGGGHVFAPGCGVVLAEHGGVAALGIGAGEGEGKKKEDYEDREANQDCFDDA